MEIYVYIYIVTTFSFIVVGYIHFHGDDFILSIYLFFYNSFPLLSKVKFV